MRNIKQDIAQAEEDVLLAKGDLAKAMRVLRVRKSLVKNLKRLHQEQLEDFICEENKKTDKVIKKSPNHKRAKS